MRTFDQINSLHCFFLLNKSCLSNFIYFQVGVPRVKLYSLEILPSLVLMFFGTVGVCRNTSQKIVHRVFYNYCKEGEVLSLNFSQFIEYFLELRVWQFLSQVLGLSSVSQFFPVFSCLSVSPTNHLFHQSKASIFSRLNHNQESG